MQYPLPLILSGANMFLFTYQVPKYYHNLFSPLIDSLDPIPPYLYSSQHIYLTHIVLLTVTNNYITLHGPFYIKHGNLYTLPLAHVHGLYRVLNAELFESGTGGRGGEEGTCVVQSVKWLGRDSRVPERWVGRVESGGNKGETSYNGRLCARLGGLLWVGYGGKGRRRYLQSALGHTIYVPSGNRTADLVCRRVLHHLRWGLDHI